MIRWCQVFQASDKPNAHIYLTMTYASVAAVSHYLPPEILSNEMLESEFEEFTAQQIEDKTGIRERHISSTEDCASDSNT